MYIDEHAGKLNIRRQSFPVRIAKVGNELPDSVVNAPNVNTIKTGWTDTGGEKTSYNYKAPVPGHHLAEDRAKRFEHVDLTIEAN